MPAYYRSQVLKFSRIGGGILILLLTVTGCDFEAISKNTKAVGLKTIYVQDFKISPEFDTNISEYYLDVGHRTQSITISAEAIDSSTILLNQVAYKSPSLYELAKGNNYFIFEVAGINKEIRGYYLTIRRNVKKPFKND